MNTLILPALNLLVLLAFVFYKTRAPFAQFLKDRYENIVTALNQSKRQAAVLDTKKKEVELKFAQLESDRKKIFETWKQQEVAQAKAIQESSTRIIAQMKKDAEFSKLGLEDSLRSEAVKALAEHTLRLAKDKIQQKLNPEAHKKIIDRFVAEVSRT